MASAFEQLAANFSYSALSKAEDLQKRIWFTLAVLIVYRIGTYIPLPGVNPEVIGEFARSNAGGILGILDMFSGGAISRMTIFALNIMPYISASIIVQLMTSISPHFEALKKEGESGKRKLTQYTRYGTVILAILQSLGISAGLLSLQTAHGPAVFISPFVFKLITVITLTGSTLFIMWLGEQITARGVGNGTSLIIFSGIVANLPQAVLNTLELGRTGALSSLIIVGILVMVALVISYIVFMEKAQRRVLIQYPKRQTAVNMPATSQTSHLPIKLNSAGVIPPIFASSLLLLPGTVIGFSGVDPDSIFAKISSYFSHGNPVYIISFVALIVFFAFFYTALTFNPTETAENLRKGGSFIPGIRPGKSTADFLDYVLTRLTAVGSLYLASICILPELILMKVQLPFYLGGTSLLIVVSVTIETLSQVQSHLLAHQYEGLFKQSRLKR